MRTPKGVWHCTMCGEKYRSTELKEFRQMHEEYIHLGDAEESNEIICPDCMDRWVEMDENEKFDYLCKTEGGRL